MKKIIEAIESIEEYYNSIEDYLKSNQSLKTKLESLFNKINKLKINLSKLSDNLEGKFDYIHQYVLLSYLLGELYNLMDFEIPVNDEFSKTRSLRTGEMFDKITKIYKLYIYDVASHSDELVAEFAKSLISKNIDYKEITDLWKKYPQSIQLYTLLMNNILDQKYRDRDFETINSILKVLDDNKRFILEEKEFISPFLTFGLSIWLPSLILQEEEKAKEEKGEKVEGTIIIKRHETNNILYNLPPQNFLATKGITKNDIFHLYSIVPNPKASTFQIIEELTPTIKRVLVPFAKQSSSILSRNESIVERILAHEFGRPYVFYSEIDHILESQLDERVANLSIEDSQHDIVDLGLNIMDLTDLMTKNFSTKYLEEKIYEDYEKHIFKVLESYVEDTPMDLVFLWIEKSKAEFKKEIEIVKFSDDKIEINKLLHDMIAKVLKKNNNIFQDLIAKLHKLKLVEANTK